MKALFLYLGTASLTAFFLFGLDKRRALRGKWRISERTLLLVTLLGGSAGALLAMLLFRHKIRKPKFYLGVPACLLLHIALLLFKLQFPFLSFFFE